MSDRVISVEELEKYLSDYRNITNDSGRFGVVTQIKPLWEFIQANSKDVNHIVDTNEMVDNCLPIDEYLIEKEKEILIEKILLNPIHKYPQKNWKHDYIIEGYFYDMISASQLAKNFNYSIVNIYSIIQRKIKTSYTKLKYIFDIKEKQNNPIVKVVEENFINPVNIQYSLYDKIEGIPIYLINYIIENKIDIYSFKHQNTVERFFKHDRDIYNVLESTPRTFSELFSKYKKRLLNKE